MKTLIFITLTLIFALPAMADFKVAMPQKTCQKQGSELELKFAISRMGGSNWLTSVEVGDCGPKNCKTCLLKNVILENNNVYYQLGEDTKTRVLIGNIPEDISSYYKPDTYEYYEAVPVTLNEPLIVERASLKRRYQINTTDIFDSPFISAKSHYYILNVKNSSNGEILSLGR